MEEIIESVEPSYEWGDMYLKFDSEEAATAALENYPGSIDIIGVIYKPTGQMLQSDDGEVPEVVPLEGWHVNVRGPRLFDLEPFNVNPEPSTPVRVWA